jgi:uncharacterized protein (TIGR03437 family)
VLRITDINNLPYPGSRVQALSSLGGSVLPAVATADARGQVSFQWTPGTGKSLTLQLFLDGTLPSTGVTVTAHVPHAVDPTAAVSAASGELGLAPGAIGSIAGFNLAGGANQPAPFPWPFQFLDVGVTVNGEPARLLSVRDDQVIFLVPADVPVGNATIIVTNPIGTSNPLAVPVKDLAPAIFVLHDNLGAILNAGTAQTTADVPATRGRYIEIYCTGLGVVFPSTVPDLFRTVATPYVLIGGQPATVTFSGLAPAYQMGLYQVNVQVPLNISAGLQDLIMLVNGIFSNGVLLKVQ